MDKAVKSLWRWLGPGAGTRAAGVQRLLRDETGQDLIEYALIFCFVMLGAIASMRSVATSIGVLFAGVGSVLTTAL